MAVVTQSTHGAEHVRQLVPERYFVDMHERQSVAEVHSAQGAVQRVQVDPSKNFPGGQAVQIPGAVQSKQGAEQVRHVLVGKSQYFPTGQSYMRPVLKFIGETDRTMPKYAVFEVVVPTRTLPGTCQTAVKTECCKFVFLSINLQLLFDLERK